MPPKSNINIPCSCNPTNCPTCDRCGGSGLVPLESTYKPQCIVCGEGMTLTDDFVLNGAEFTITVGYGSSHDGDIFHGYICDKCITAKEKVDALRFTRNYMYPQITPQMYKEIARKG